MRLTDAFEAFLRHLEHERQCSPLTVVAYRADFYQYLAWLDRTLEMERAQGVRRPITRPNDLAHFTTERIRAWQASLSLERRLSPTTVRKKIHALASFTKFLMRTGAIGRNPLDGVTPPKPRGKVRLGIPLETWQRVLALPLAPREATIRGVLAWAGLRRSEVLELRVSDLRLGDVYPTCVVRGKGDKERVVPVPLPLRELLLDYCLRMGRTGRERLFQTDAREPIHPSTLTAWVKGWGQAAGMPSLHPHLFRHTYASGLIASGVPIDAVQAWLGHASLATTAAYLHTAQSQSARHALDGWASAMSPPTSIATPSIDRGSPLTSQGDAPNAPSA
jgi:site-specific recombinase XerD